MQVRFAKGCAYSQLGRAAEAAVERAYVDKHRLDAPSARFELYLCMKDYDAAAANLIERLRDPEDRPQLLAIFADYDERPVKSRPTVTDEA